MTAPAMTPPGPSSPPLEEALDHRLRGLPPLDLDDVAAERIRRRAQRVLAEERRLARRPWLRPVATFWSRAAVPALLTGTVSIYLLWAVETAGTLLRSRY